MMMNLLHNSQETSYTVLDKKSCPLKFSKTEIDHSVFHLPDVLSNYTSFESLCSGLSNKWCNIFIMVDLWSAELSKANSELSEILIF